MESEDKEEFIAFWQQEEQAPFSGWDFSYLDGRMIEEGTPWQYEELAMELMAGAENLLDLGTGGGERLLSMYTAWPAEVVVTEGYPPNVALAKSRLEPFGVKVVENSGEAPFVLPFSDNSFDLIIDRHTGYNFDEVARVLKKNGRFLTQQVDSSYGIDLKRAMGVTPPEKDPSLTRAVRYLAQTDLWLETAVEHSGVMTFTDVGAVVYYLKAVSFAVPGFSVETHLPYLMALQEKMEQEGSLQFHIKKYMLQARKP